MIETLPMSATTAQARRTSRIKHVAIALALIAGVLALAFGAAWKWESDHAREHEVTFIVPPGTALHQANGKDDLMLPKQIWLVAGEHDTLIIRNLDDFPVRVGPFKLEAGQQYRQRFRSTGALQLICASMYHEEELKIVVMETRDPIRKVLSKLFRQN